MKKKETNKTEYIEKELKKPIYKVIGKEYIDRIYSVIVENKYLTFLSLILIVIIFYFLTAISSLEEKIKIQVQIPPKLYRTGTIYIGYQTANSLFYKLWGEYVAREIGNYSPVDVDERIKKVIYLFAPDKIIKAQAEFIKFAKDVQKNMVTSVFTPYKVTADDKGNVVVEGLKHKTLGANLLNEIYICSYNMKFVIRDYHLFLDSLVNNCQLINKAEEKAYLERIKKEKREEKLKLLQKAKND